MDFSSLFLMNLLALLLGIAGIGYINDCWRKGEYAHSAQDVYHGVYVSIFILIVMLMAMSLLFIFGQPEGVTEEDWLILAAEYIAITVLGGVLSVYTYRFYKKCKRGFYL